MVQRVEGVRHSARVRRHFIYMAVLFSANHGCVVACLSLATARLGSLGAWQSGLLYFIYALSGLFGSTYIVKKLGSRNALACGMGLYCAYVGAFGMATIMDPTWSKFIAACGAISGGVGAGFLWTAQGAYFAGASSEYQQALESEERESEHDSGVPEAASQSFAGTFAFTYLLFEVALRALSTFLQKVTHMSWTAIFGVYAVIAIVSTMGMVFVESPATTSNENGEAASVWYKATAAWQLLVRDPKMKYMIGLNAVFGWTSAFLTSYVNGQVVFQVLGSDSYVGVLSAWVSCVAAASSLVVGRVHTKYRGFVLSAGSLCFAAVAVIFMVFPRDVEILLLILAYTLHGLGRSTFESTLRSTFADFFTDKEGAFANIILQNGLTSALGFVLTFQLQCSSSSPYCVEYRDGNHHDVLMFEVLIVATALLAILGYQKAFSIHEAEREYEPLVSTPLTGENVPEEAHETSSTDNPGGDEVEEDPPIC